MERTLIITEATTYDLKPATKELYRQLRPVFGGLLYNVRFEHVDQSGYWFSFELVNDHRRQNHVIRHRDIVK